MVVQRDNSRHCTKTGLPPSGFRVTPFIEWLKRQVPEHRSGRSVQLCRARGLWFG